MHLTHTIILRGGEVHFLQCLKGHLVPPGDGEPDLCLEACEACVIPGFGFLHVPIFVIVIGFSFHLFFLVNISFEKLFASSPKIFPLGFLS